MEKRSSRWIVIGVAVALVALVAWTAWQRWLILDDTPFPVGIDGYFYPIQLRSILETGHLAYSDSPLAFYLMTPFAAATDPIVGAKLAAAFFGALAVLPAFAVGARLGKSHGAGLVAAAIVATSAGASYLTIEFVKNGIGMTVALTAVWLILRASERTPLASRPSLRPAIHSRTAMAFVACVAAFATHKLAGAFVALFVAPAIVADLSDRGVLRGRRLLYAILVVVLVTFGALLIAGKGLLGDAFSRNANLAAPALARGNQVLLPMGHEALISAVLAWLALVTLAFKLGPPLSRTTRAVAAVLVLLGIAIAFPWLAVEDSQGLGFRLRVIAFLPMALCAAIITGAAHRIGARIQLAVLAVIALLILIAMPHRRIEGRIVAHPAMVAAVQAMTGDVPSGDVVIVPERHIMFMVTWYTRIPARLDPDPVPEAKRWRAMPLAFIGAQSPLDQLLMEARREPTIPAPIGLHPRHPNGFVLVREQTWKWLLEQMSPDARAHYAAWPTI